MGFYIWNAAVFTKNMTLHYTEQFKGEIWGCVLLMLHGFFSDSGSGACIEASSDELNSRIAALNLEDPELPRHPLYPQLVNNCDVVHVEGKGQLSRSFIRLCLWAILKKEIDDIW